MKKILIFIFITFALIGCSKHRVVTKAKESDVLDLLDKGNLSSFRMEAISLEILNAGDVLVKEYISRMKIRYPKFSEDLLYAGVARDENNQYSIIFRPEDRKCVLFTNKNEQIKKVKMCYEKFNQCMSGKEIDDISPGEINSCLKHKDCSVISNMDKGRIVNKKYCEVIYGRSL